jgi:hypothetical protein
VDYTGYRYAVKQKLSGDVPLIVRGGCVVPIAVARNGFSPGVSVFQLRADRLLVTAARAARCSLSW